MSRFHLLNLDNGVEQAEFGPYRRFQNFLVYRVEQVWGFYKSLFLMGIPSKGSVPTEQS